MNAGAVSWAALGPALIAAVVVALLRRTRAASLLADHPNERSLHSTPRPRVGGIGILAGALSIGLSFAEGPGALILACALGLGLLSLLDDLRSLPVALRLSAHLLAALVVMSTVAYVPAQALAWHWIAWLAAVVSMVWMTNLFNFMDGADGLAGSMAIVGFGAYALGAALAGQASLALVSLAIASAAAGFLPFNFPPARVFMGDAGSIPLGFLAAALGVQGVASGAWPVPFPVLAFSPFIVDATFTLLRRLLRRERVWQAHRTHHYQRLVLAGWSTRRLLASSALLMVACAASAVLLARAGLMLQCGIIFFWAVAYALLLPAIDRESTKNTNTAR